MIEKNIVNFENQSTFMKDTDLIKEIGEIRSLMEKSSKFMSISGLSGVLIGVFALIASYLGYGTVYGFEGENNLEKLSFDIICKLLGIALVLLVLCITTGVIMAKHKSNKAGQSIWNFTSKALFKSMLLPLCTGGIIALILISKGEYQFLISTLLIFYGFSLVAASNFSFKELYWLGVLEIALGLVALYFSGYGVWFWAFGFGVLHIVYGLLVYQRYEK